MQTNEIITRLENIKKEIEAEMDTARENLYHTEKYLTQQIDYVIKDLEDDIENQINEAVKDSDRRGVLAAAEGESCK